MTLTVTVPEGQTVVATGRAEAPHSADGKSRFVFRAQQPTLAGTLAVGNFHKVSISEGAPVTFYLRGVRESAARASAGPVGDIITFFSDKFGPLESPALAVYDGLYYLFYNDTSQRGERYRIGASPAGPWAEADAFAPGWAHEVWRGPKGDDYTSFLTTYAVSISKLSWDTLYSPARPVVGEIHRSWLPLMSR